MAEFSRRSQCVDQSERRAGTFHHSDGHGAIERYDWRRPKAFEDIVEAHDL